MKHPSRIALAALLVALLSGLAWVVNVNRMKGAGLNAPFNSLEFHGISADSGRSTNLIALGEWSKPVKDAAGYILRGRLLVFDTPHFASQFALDKNRKYWGNSPVHLELQNLSSRNDQPLAVYFDFNDGLECELRDAQGQSVPTSLIGYDGPSGVWTVQYWATIPVGGSVRLRADPQLGGFSPKPNGLVIQLNFGTRWIIPAGESQPYSLSGDFSPPTNHPGPPDSHVWSGRLELPPVRIPSPKP